MILIHSLQEAWHLSGAVPETVLDKIVHEMAELKKNGTSGYSIIVQNEADLAELQSQFNFSSLTCEWAAKLGTSGYLSALFVLDNETTAVLYMPISLASESFIKEMED